MNNMAKMDDSGKKGRNAATQLDRRDKNATMQPSRLVVKKKQHTSSRQVADTDVSLYVNNKSRTNGFSSVNCNSISDYNIDYDHVLGRGRFSTVHPACFKNGYPVAVKVYPKHRIITNQYARMNLKRETAILNKLARADCPNLLRMFECIDTNDRVHLILEKVDGQTLDKVV